MDKLKQWFRQQFLKVIRKLAVWGLTKLAVAGIDEANGESLGKEIKARLPEQVWKSIDVYLGEIRLGLRG